MISRSGLHLRGHRRLLALIAGVVMLALVLSASAAKSTLAGWTADDSSHATFTAGTIGPVQNLQCVDSEDVLGTGLLAREAKLVWDAPAGVPNGDLEYVVTWQAALLGDSGSAVVKLPVNGRFEYKYTPRALLSALTVNFTVRARTTVTSDSWEGPTRSASATSVGVIVPVLLRCN